MAQQVYFVTALTNAPEVRERLGLVIENPALIYELANDKWLVAFDGISSDLAEKLQIRTDPHIGTGLVFPVGAYSGRAPTDVWEWLRLRTTQL
jgi:hypothetical protein